MRGTLLSRVFAGYAVLAIALACVILLLAFRIVSAHYTETLAVGLRNLSFSIAVTAKPLLAEGRHEDLNDLARHLGARAETRITITDADGVVWGDSDENPGSMENHRTRPEIMKALAGEVGESTRLSSTLNQRMLYVAVPVMDDGEIVGAVRASTFVKDIRGAMHGMERGIIEIAIVIVAACLAAGFVLSRSLTKPISRLKDAARTVGSGNFSASVILKGPREIEELGESFNFMTERMKNLVADLSQRQDQLGNIISSIHDALVVIDPSGKILLANESFCLVARSQDERLRTAACNDLRGRFYWEVLRAPEFADLVREAAGRSEAIEREMSIEERTYAASGGALGQDAQVLVLFHDITEIKNLERVKRDFVVNLSHELRTPLTAIKGFAETLEDEADPRIKSHVEVIRRHTDRLIAIVDDLLRLSELETKESPLETEVIDLKEIIVEAVRILQPKATAKSLRLALDADAGPHTAVADAFKMEQVFLNLIDNALKYTERGSVTISLRRQDGRLIAEVADTGVGMAAEHLPRIFERFYVVDRARSKKVGGTGLGLAIAKHIVLMHNGEIAVESTPGKGTRFSVILPAR